jgi:hypothetical protein
MSVRYSTPHVHYQYCNGQTCNMGFPVINYQNYCIWKIELSFFFIFFFISVYFVLFSLISFCFLWFRFISFSFRWFRFVSFRFVSISLISFRFVSFLFRFALYRYPDQMLDISIRKHEQNIHKKTWDLLQTTGSKNKPNIVFMRKS